MNVSLIAVAASLALAAGTSHAADWPSRPIVVLDGFAPGGGIIAGVVFVITRT